MVEMDDGAFHLETIQEKSLPVDEINAYNHMAIYLRWCMEHEYLCPALRGHIQYFAASYSKSADHEGRAAIRVEGAEVLRSNLRRNGMKTVICFGDSNTYGYDPRSYLGGRYGPDSRWVDLLAARTGWDVRNQGQNGRTIPGGPVPFPADTDLLTVMLGTNDLLQGRGPETAAERMERFLSALDLERGRLLLIAPPPMALGAWVPDPALVEASRDLAPRYRRLAAGLGVRFADAGAWGVALAYDGVHFAPQGHRAFAAGLCEALGL